MTKCMRNGCTRSGTHHLRAKVWAKGFPKSSPPIVMTVGLQLCRDHARAEEDSHACITDAVWDALRAITRARGLMPVDPDSLEVEAVRGDAQDTVGAFKARLQ